MSLEREAETAVRARSRNLKRGGDHYAAVPFRPWVEVSSGGLATRTC